MRKMCYQTVTNFVHLVWGMWCTELKEASE